MIAKFTRLQASKIAGLARSEAGRQHLAKMLETHREAAQTLATLKSLDAYTPKAASEAAAIAFNITVLEKALGAVKA